MKEPLLSIIIPLFNRIDLVEETLQSVQLQTYPHWEAVVVDDGSTDGSYEQVAQYVNQDPRIRLYRRDRLPKGASVCRNIGAEKASGDYLIFLDSDDLLAPFCLEQRLRAFVLYPQSDFISFAMLRFREDPYDLNVYYNIDKVGKDDFLRFIQFDALWQTTGPMYTKVFFQKTGGFDELLPYRQDYEFHLRTLTHHPRYHKMLHLQPDCFLRSHENDSISQGDVHNVKKLPIKEQVFLKVLKIIRQDTTYDWSRYYPAFDAMLLSVAQEWVRFHHNLPEALRVWKRYGQASTLPTWLYMVGRCYLYGGYWLYRKPSALNRVLNKLLRMSLPTALVVPPNTLNQVRHQGGKPVGQNAIPS